MNLTEELFKILKNESEPLKTRLQLADNILKNSEGLFKNTECLLINWLLEYLNKNNIESWKKLLEWILSKYFDNLPLNSVTISEWKKIIHSIVTNLTNENNEEVKKIIVEISIIIFENKIVQFIFKNDLELYCKFLFLILKEIDSPLEFIKFLSKEVLLNKNITSEKYFLTYFVHDGILELIIVKKKFHGNKNVYDAILNFIEKCIFHHTRKYFESYFSYVFDDVENPKEEMFLPKLLLKTLKTMINSENSNLNEYFNIIFESYNHYYKKNYVNIYKFIIVILELLNFSQTKFSDNTKIKYRCEGVDMKQYLNILITIFNTISSSEFDLNIEVNTVRFDTFLEDLVFSIIDIVKVPTKNVYEVLLKIFSIIPLSVEKHLDVILPYVLFTSKDDEKYSDLLIAIIDIFAKLHRVQNFVSKIIKISKTYLCENKIESAIEEEVIIENFFSENVLNHFTNCIRVLASWQVMNIFKTLLFHLKELNNNLETSAIDYKFVLYIEILSSLVCLLLTTTRIAEHTVSNTIVGNFLSGMKELEEFLKNFGTVILKMEHNPRLMRAYLNISYNWSDLLILLNYHSTNKEPYFDIVMDGDFSGCNITFTHPYLTRNQWCLISERVTNFGEAPCKKIMQKLFIQKLKAMFVFDKLCDEAQANVIRILSSNLKNIWKDLISDTFVLKHIIPKLEQSVLIQLSDLVFNDIIKNTNCSLLKNAHVLDCELLMSGLIFTCVEKISGLFREKRKNSNSYPKKMKTFLFFTEIPIDLILNVNNTVEEGDGCIDSVIKSFLKFEEILNVNYNNFNLNTNKVEKYLDFFTKLPVLFLPKQTITVLFLLFVIITVDLIEFESPLIKKCEDIIHASLKTGSILFEKIHNVNFILKVILQYFQNYLEIFLVMFVEVLKKFSSTEILENIIDFLLNNVKSEKGMKITIASLEHLSKQKKYKVNSDRKTELTHFEIKILDKLTSLVQEDDFFEHPVFIETFSIVLKDVLSKDDEPMLKILLPILEKLLKLENIDQQNEIGYIKLLTVVFHNRNKIEISEELLLKAWNFCKVLKIDSRKSDKYYELLSLVFGQISNEQFEKISQELLEITIQEFEKNGDFTYYRFWPIILRCNFNNAKFLVLQNLLDTFFNKSLAIASKNNEILLDIIDFELTLIKSAEAFLSGPTIDNIFTTVDLLITSKIDTDFYEVFSKAASVLECLLKYRKFLVLDRLPSFLLLFRLLTNQLCLKSGKELENDTTKISDCAHKLERIVTSLCSNGKHVARITPYVIADILGVYEKITLQPSVKFHLNNCLYQLMSLCDEHSISYCLRILSSSSTELFKIAYKNYKKYYKFSGKV